MLPEQFSIRSRSVWSNNRADVPDSDLRIEAAPIFPRVGTPPRSSMPAPVDRCDPPRVEVDRFFHRWWRVRFPRGGFIVAGWWIGSDRPRPGVGSPGGFIGPPCGSALGSPGRGGSSGGRGSSSAAGRWARSLPGRKGGAGGPGGGPGGAGPCPLVVALAGGAGPLALVGRPWWGHAPALGSGGGALAGAGRGWGGNRLDGLRQAGPMAGAMAGGPMVAELANRPAGLPWCVGALAGRARRYRLGLAGRAMVAGLGSAGQPSAPVSARASLSHRCLVESWWALQRLCRLVGL